MPSICIEGWILNDTYPTRVRHDLANFHLPIEYAGEWRRDTHPRSSKDGRCVTVDSPHAGTGRQVWLLDVSEIVA